MAQSDVEDDAPRRKLALDEVNEAHAASGEYVPPLGPDTGLSLSAKAGILPPPLPPSVGPIPTVNASPTMMPAPAPTPSMDGFQQTVGMSPATPMPSMAPLGSMGANTSMGMGMGTGMGMSNGAAAAMAQSGAAQAQAQASVGLAQTSIDQQVVTEQISKESEHWVKAYWRPAMGWLYMLICLMDFIAFPAMSMFLPVIFKGFGITINYMAWQSLTLSNGGLIHLAFGAILGVSAWTRGQEKIASMR